MTSIMYQCHQCGGASTHGHYAIMQDARRWLCIWCHDGYEGWPRVGDWRPPQDDRTYPEGDWILGKGTDECRFDYSPETEAKREALHARGYVPKVASDG